MSIAIVNSADVNTKAASLSVSPGTVSVGNTVIFFFFIFADTGTGAVSDNLGNTWTHDASYVNNTWSLPGAYTLNAQISIHFYRCVVATGGSMTVTFSPGATRGMGGAAVEVSGLAASPLDSHSAGVSTTGTPISVGSWTTTNANDLLLILCQDHGSTGTITSPSGFTSLGKHFVPPNDGHEAMYEIVSAIQSAIAPAWDGFTSTTSKGACGLAYKAAFLPAWAMNHSKAL